MNCPDLLSMSFKQVVVFHVDLGLSLGKFLTVGRELEVQSQAYPH